MSYKMGSTDGPEELLPCHDIGLLFVHGIGQQKRGATLLQAGEATREVLDQSNGIFAGISGASITDALLVTDPQEAGAPAHALMTVHDEGSPKNIQSWLLAESRWAENFHEPTYTELVGWGVQVIPWTLTAHFGTRLRRIVLPWWRSFNTEEPAGDVVVTAPDQVTRGSTARLNAAVRTIASLISATGTFLVALALFPVVVSLILLLLVVGLVPIRSVRSLVLKVQTTLAGSLGDSLVLLNHPIQEAAIYRQVRQDLEWLSHRCERVVVLGHSQGAAISHAVARDSAPAKLTMLITFGSGLRKLEEIRQLRESTGRPDRWGPWVGLFGFVLTGLALPSVGRALWAERYWLLLSVAAWLLLVILVIFARSKAKRGAELSLAASIAAAVAVIILGMPPVFMVADRLDAVLWVFIGGIALFVTGSVIPFKGAVIDVDKIALPEGIEWVDLYASADPVPNGPLLDVPDPRVETITVYNRGSILRDHSTYWSNQDGFVGQVVGRVASKVTANDQQDGATLDLAAARRTWRVRWLTVARVLFVGLALLIPVRGWDSFMSADWAVPLIDRLISMAGWLPILEIPGQFENDLLSRSRWAALTILLSVLAAGYLFISGVVWRWWTGAEVKAMFQRASLTPPVAPFVVFVLMLALVSEAGVLALLGWAEGLALGALGAVVYGFYLGMFLSFLHIAKAWRALLVEKYETSAQHVRRTVRVLLMRWVFSVLVLAPPMVRFASLNSSASLVEVQNAYSVLQLGSILGVIVVLILVRYVIPKNRKYQEWFNAGKPPSLWALAPNLPPPPGPSAKRPIDRKQA